MIEIESIGRPRPAPKFSVRFSGDILELPISKVLIKGISAGMTPIKRLDIFGIVCMKVVLSRDSQPCRGPHVSDIDILLAVAIEIEPASAHAGSYIFYSRFGRN